MAVKQLHATVERNASGKMVAVATTESTDRDGEVIKLSAWDIASFSKNPVMLWAHNHMELPIGRAENVSFSTVGGKAAMTFEPAFHDETDQARAIGKLYEKGILTSFSVGFIPHEREGNTITRAELVEISGVNVPANADARVFAKGFSAGELKTIGELIGKDIEAAVEEPVEEPADEAVEPEADPEKEALQVENEKLKATIAALEGQLAAKARELAEANNKSKGQARVRDLLKAVIVRANKARHELE